MKKYTTLLFDLDGTLTASAQGIINSAVYALEKFGINVDDKSQLKKFIGPPLLQSFEEFYGFDEEKSKLAISYYREYYHEKGKFENKVYDGIYELLEDLKKAGYKLIVATSKPEKFAIEILEHFKLDKYFDLMAGALSDNSRSSKYEVIEYALNKANISNLEDVLMIGDRKHDVIGAKKAGIKVLGVLYGYGSRDELNEARADYIVETVDKLHKYFI